MDRGDLLRVINHQMKQYVEIGSKMKMTNERELQLRRRAEALMARSPSQLRDIPKLEMQRLIEELHLQHAEIEIQNADLMEAARELQVSRDSYQKLYHASPAGYICLTKNGKILEANQTAGKMLQCPHQDLVGLAFSSFMSSAEADNLFLLMTEVTAQRTSRQCKLTLRIQGEERTFQVDLVPNQDDLGSGLVRLAMIDITLTTLANREKKALQLQLQEVDRRKAVGTLAGGMAHQFNNLLLPILAQAEMAKAQIEEGCVIHQNLDEIVNLVERAKLLCEGMLDDNASEPLKKEPVDLRSLLNRIRSSLASRIPPTIEFDILVREPIGHIDGNPLQLEQLLNHLLSNAIESIDANGRVLLSFESVSVDTSQIATMTNHEMLSPGNYISLKVTDNGCGMDGLAVARIFDPYFSTKFPGRGLGMLTVSRVVEAHHAGMSIESAPNRGTTVEILFPEGTGQPSAPSPSVTSSKIPSLGGRVLIVDDERSVRDSLEGMLTIAGCECETAESGQAAIEKTTCTMHNFDLVLVDLTMPEMNGVETIQALQPLLPNSEFVVMSGFAEEKIWSQIGDLDIAAILRKPCRMQVLIGTLQSVLERV